MESPIRSRAARRILAIAALAALALPSLALAQSSAGGYTADLGISAKGPSDADRGKAFTYMLTLSNAGPAIAQDVEVTVPLFAGLSFEKKGSDASCRQEQGKVVCAFPYVMPSKPLSFAVNFRTSYQDGCSYRTYDFTFDATAYQHDPVTANNTTLTQRTGIRCTPRPPECSDEIDNDNDGFIDMDDAGCASATGDYERQDQVSYYRRPSTIRSYSSSSSSSRSFRSSSRSSVKPVGQDVRINMTTDVSTARPGETFSIRIAVYNPTLDVKRGTAIRFSYDPTQIGVEGGDRGQDTGASYRWQFDLLPRQTRILRLTATVLPSVQPGTLMTATAKVEDAAITRVSALNVPVSVTMPQTGASPFTSALESSFLSPLSHGGNGMLLLFVLIPLGLIAGGAGMRKMQKERM